MSEEQELMKRRAKQINAKLDQFADTGMAKAQGSKYTWVFVLAAVAIVLGLIVWLIPK